MTGHGGQHSCRRTGEGSDGAPSPRRAEVSSEERAPTGEEAPLGRSVNQEVQPALVLSAAISESLVSPELVLTAGGACWVRVEQHVTWE